MYNLLDQCKYRIKAIQAMYTIKALDRLIGFPKSIDEFFRENPQAKKEYLHLKEERNLPNARVFLLIVLVSQIIVASGRLLADLGIPYYNLSVALLCLTLLWILRYRAVFNRTTTLSMLLFMVWASSFPFFIIRLGGYSSPTYPVYIIMVLYILVFFHYEFMQYVILFLAIYFSNILIYFLWPEIGVDEFVYRQTVMAIVVGVGSVGAYVNVRNRQREFHAQYALKVQKKELERAYARLEEAELQIVQSEKMASLGKLAAGMAHEINNPLGIVSGNLEALEVALGDVLAMILDNDKVVNDAGGPLVYETLSKSRNFSLTVDDAKAALDSARRGANRITIILEKLKHFSRLDEAKFKPAAVNDCIDAALAVIDPKGAAIVRNFADLPEIVCMPALLNQVFHAIIENAVEAIPAGKDGGTVTVSSRTEDSAGNRRVIVEVSDNGCGMDEKTMAKVFDPFFTTKDVGKGQGLGLALAHGIISQHGGSISCASRPHGGTTFVIMLPFGTVKGM